jgi:hypothetical protein
MQVVNPLLRQTSLLKRLLRLTLGSALNQAFQDLMVQQRQGGKNVIVYPNDVATGKLIPRAVK